MDKEKNMEVTNKQKSYSQQKREKYDYRKHYLKHNPGLFGHYYICSQCGKFLEEEQMEVDHIIPNSSPLAPNRVINCVAICSACNKKKSNKIGKVTVKGIIAKLLEEPYILVHKSVVTVIRLLGFVCRLTINLAIKSIGYSRSPLLKVGLVACYIVIAIYIFYNIISFFIQN